MFHLRCTKKLADRMKRAPDPDAIPLSDASRLGDWFANLLVIRRQQIVLAVSEVTLLPVLLPAAPFKTIPQRVPVAVEEMLLALGIERARVAEEIAAMAECRIEKTNSRQILGSMLDFAFMLEGYLDGRPLRQVALHLAEAPCGPIAMNSPRGATVALLGQPARPAGGARLHLVRS